MYSYIFHAANSYPPTGNLLSKGGQFYQNSSPGVQNWEVSAISLSQSRKITLPECRFSSIHLTPLLQWEVCILSWIEVTHIASNTFSTKKGATKIVAYVPNQYGSTFYTLTSAMVLPWRTPLSLSPMPDSPWSWRDKPDQPGVPWDYNWARGPPATAPLHRNY